MTEETLINIENQTDRTIFQTLSEGRAFTRREIALFSKIDKKEIISRLEILVNDQLIEKLKYNGRYYFRLSEKAESSQVIHAIQKGLNSQSITKNEESSLSDLQYCRSCYHHLAGWMGVQLAEKLQQKEMILLKMEDGKNDFILTPKGQDFLLQMGMDTTLFKNDGNTKGKACLDFSERKYHIGGGLGVILLEMMFNKQWIRRINPSRAIEITPKGRKEFFGKLKMSV